MTHTPSGRPFFHFPVLLIAALVCMICGVPQALAGDPQWVEVHSPHFSVVTDAGERRGREVAMRFEQMRAVFGALMTKANVNLPTPLQIVAFRNSKELRQVAPLFNGKPTQVAGLFQQGSDRSFIMLDMSVEDPWTVVFHEYAHQLMNGNLKGEFDPWFQEGFAEYFSSIDVAGSGAKVGKIPDDEYRIVQQLGMMKIADLFRVRQNTQTYNESGDHRTTFYAESGFLMHYIFDNQMIPKVGTYFDLVENRHVAVEDAIQQAFGMSAPQFDKVLQAYVNSGKFKYYPIPTPATITSNSYSVTPVSPTEASAVLADIHLHSIGYQDRALTEFEEILKSDPNNAAACRGLGYAYLQKQDYAKSGEYFKRATQLDSKDPRVHYYYALLMMRENESHGVSEVGAMTRELETAIALDPTFADSYALLAFAQSTSGEPAKAIVTMRKALEINPQNPDYRFNLANLYMANRQPDQAIALLQSLRNSSRPELALRAANMLEQAQQFAEIIRRGPPNAQPQIAESMVATKDEGSNASASTVPLRSVPASFLQGTLTEADCSNPPSVTLTVISGSKTWKMKVADRNHLVLIGADEFSCSWRQQKVAVNYRETPQGEAGVISLEIQ